MDQGQVFQLQDVIDYLGRTYPGLPINQGQLLERILYLIVINHLDVYTTAPHYVDFEDNVTYVPQGVIQYATALIEGKGNAYITPADPFNQTNNLLDSNLLFVMKLLAAPRTRASLLQELSQLSITKTTPDGLSYQISPEQYLDDCLRKLKSLAYLAK